MEIVYNFVVIGAGNLGTRLAIALKKSGHNALQIISRDQRKAKDLASKVGASYGTGYQINENADIVFIAVNDDSIAMISSELKSSDFLCVHLSGSTSISVLEMSHRNSAVLYPLQSFTADVEIEFSNIPVLLEASNLKSLEILRNIANSISDNVIEMSSEDRLKCHLGAIIAANFSNHFISLGEKYLVDNNLPPEIIHPLLDEMLSKVKRMGAEKAQTGPARRNDVGSIQKHIELLQNDPHLQKMYSFVSESIINHYKNNF